MRLIVFGTILFTVISCQQSQEIKKQFLFEEVSALTSGVNFKNVIPESATMNSFVYEYYYNGGGVAVGDVNGDKLEDIFFTSNLGANALYLNTGDFQFIDISKHAGIEGKEGWSTGVSMVDINADGKLDIYVCYSGPFEDGALRANELYINQGNDQSGNPNFKESAEAYGLASTAFSTQAAYLDYDLDGDLDVYLLNHNPSRITEEELTSGRKIKSHIGDQFFENIDGVFEDKTTESGIYSNAISYGLGIGVGDLNQDGWPDIYVSNDYEELDYIYLNQQNKTFKEAVTSTTRHISNFSMGNDIADYDNNGYIDVLVLDMVSEDNYGIKTSMPSMNPALFNKRLSQGFHYQYMYNTLQRHTTHIDEGDPKFTDAGRLAGITNTGWSWAPLMADFDNDGWKDVFITNGIKRDFRNNDFNIYLKGIMATNSAFLDDPKNMEEVLNKIPKKPLKNYLYKNNGYLTFEKVTDSWMESAAKSLSNGAAYADLDNDGDLDLIVNNIDDKAFIFKNNSNNHFLKISLEGPEKNPEGIGAKVWVYANGKSQFMEHYRVRGFQSSVASSLTFGVGTATVIDSVNVVWPSGKTKTLTQVKADQELKLYENDAASQQLLADEPSTIFTKKSVSKISHQENEFDDYAKQVLLPHKLSQMGPAIAIGDINGDGLDDMFVGQAIGSRSVVYTQSKTGELQVSQNFGDQSSEAIDAVFFDFDNDGDVDLYVVNGGNEYEPQDSRYADHFYLNQNGIFEDASNLLPNLAASGSVVRPHDFDNDGFTDLFVGTRQIPGDYPSPASSHILKNTGERFEDVTNVVASDLANLGLVTDMTWSDVDQDGDQDMIVVGEWMAPTVFSYDSEKFTKVSNQTLDSLKGWYFSVNAIDIDNDGDEDYVLGNLGNNYKYQASAAEPFEVYYADFDQSGTKDIVLGYYNFGELFPVRGRQCSSQQVPDLKDKFSNYHSFGSSSLMSIYDLDNKKDVLAYKARKFSSGVLINTPIGFEFKPFPNTAQLSSINDMLIQDWDQDGHLDVLVAGNLYQSEIETPRNDASYGLLLKGNGTGQFEAMDAASTGFFVQGEVRHLGLITIKDEKYVIAAVNNASMIFHKVSQ